MTNVIAFRPERTGQSAVPPEEATGRVLLFTGVRYIRDEDAVEPPATARRPEPASCHPREDEIELLLA